MRNRERDGIVLISRTFGGAILIACFRLGFSICCGVKILLAEVINEPLSVVVLM